MNGNKELCVCGMMFFCLFVGCVGEKSCNEDVSEDLLYADFCSRLYAGSITRYEELKAFSCECGLPESVDILILDARISSALKVEILGSPNVFVSQSVLKKVVKTDKSEEVRIAAVRKIEDREFISKIAADKAMGSVSAVSASLLEK